MERAKKCAPHTFCFIKKTQFRGRFSNIFQKVAQFASKPVSSDRPSFSLPKRSQNELCSLSGTGDMMNYVNTPKGLFVINIFDHISGS